MKSIRKLAEELKVSHTTVNTVIKKLEKANGKKIGLLKGRSIQLNDRKCELIANAFYKPAIEETLAGVKPVSDSGLTVYETPVTSEVFQSETYKLKIFDTTDQAVINISDLIASFGNAVDNSEAVANVIVQKAAMDGVKLGQAQLVAKYGTAQKVFQTGEKDILKKMGLLEEQNSG